MFKANTVSVDTYPTDEADEEAVHALTRCLPFGFSHRVERCLLRRFWEITASI
jgi:hypothetical protein